MFDLEQLELWFSSERRSPLIQQLMQTVGLTRIRADYFVRLWVYLSIKHETTKNPQLKPPLHTLKTNFGTIICTHREAAELFYADKDQGGDRAAGMMLDKLAALGLLKKHFDGNTTCIEILPLPQNIQTNIAAEKIALILDDFDPRCDAIPVANLLATNYNWMSNNNNAVPQRIARLLRQWGRKYNVGMRVLRREDNQNPVGFYLLYPTNSESDINFFKPAKNALHLSTMSDIDPFEMAEIDDEDCVSIFIRSWMIDPKFLEEYRADFVKDAQITLKKMQKDFPNICDLYTLIIHPFYAQIAASLGFQHTHQDSLSKIHWMYQALDRFIALDIEQAIATAYDS
ncbi:hypothetical protein Lepto7376_3560 [[Leptolyngbya] sp. PCC 7376]|uniref:hypothetical protein n=1 Tax=[Leptolyngbya] sp. PCC 7376 TaxID=111781 RepID=UPI00029EE3F7|nr:hypothetical protein [[Leptolyngbya] sp. PCC 7376]AFY39751.1 hypothetical protein Lepto7376_3560 [[Leptolyngbya] sp. PCC 7376]